MLTGGFALRRATAIFEFILAETDNQPDIRYHDFGEPVIDFTVCGEGTIWVLLDADFPEESNVSDERSRKLVRAVRWSVDQVCTVTRDYSSVHLYPPTSLLTPAARCCLTALTLYARFLVRILQFYDKLV